eukprot:scaffold174004_cov12-Tisochrysis_lutea.AAC.1
MEVAGCLRWVERGGLLLIICAHMRIQIRPATIKQRTDAICPALPTRSRKSSSTPFKQAHAFESALHS